MKVTIDQSWYVRPPGVPEHESAGGVVARIRDGVVEILLITEGWRARYVLPKGHLEKGESPEEAAVREIAEEAGLRKLRLLGPLGVCERLNFEKTSWKRTHYYLLRVADDTVPARHPPEFETHWFPLDRLPKFFWPEQEKLVRDHQARIKQFLRDSTS